MDNELENRLKEINIEDIVFVIFIIIIIMSYIANEFEKKYFIYRNDKDKKIYYYLQIIIFLIVVAVNVYYVYISYLEVESLKCKEYSNKKKYAQLDLVAGLFALVASSIILYIAIDDKNINAEISL